MGRIAHLALIVIALADLACGLGAWLWATPSLAFCLWTAGTVPVVAGLGISIVRDLLAGRMGVDAVAFISMSPALAFASRAGLGSPSIRPGPVADLGHSR